MKINYNTLDIIGCSRNLAFTILIMILIASAGCGEFAGADPTPTSTTNPTTTAGEITTTPTATPSPTATTTRITTKTPEYTTSQKLSAFRDGYVESVENSGVNVSDSSTSPRNETLYITYKMQDPDSNIYTGRERENISFGYVAGVEYYLDENRSGVDESWIPKRVNVTAVTPEGELYETAYTTFERAKKMIDGEISAKRYLLEYYGTIEPGPANPDYEG